jgi:hypothetical protein
MGLAVVFVAITLISVITGGYLVGIVMLTLLGFAVYLLAKNGYISVSVKDGGFDVSFFETQPAPASLPVKQLEPKMPSMSLEEKEVFYVSGNQYTYEDAPAVCAAYESELATYEQVMDAYTAGAEWCGYGWTQGGMGLYPTQEATWETLQGESDSAKRTACGRPGVNGGYMDTSLKLGVNCYGVKPKDKGTKYPLPTPGTDPSAFNNLVNKFKGMLNTMDVNPFNRDGWSEWNLSTYAGSMTLPKVTKKQK